jgi:hypothetical protein
MKEYISKKEKARTAIEWVGMLGKIETLYSSTTSRKAPLVNFINSLHV